MNRTLAVLGVLVALLLIVLGFMVLVLDFGSPAPVPPAPAIVKKPRRPRPLPRDPLPVTGEPVLPAVVQPDVIPGLPPHPGVIVGTVSRSRTGLGDARLELLHPTGERIAETTTDDTGRYRFDGVPVEVPLVVRVRCPGFLTGYLCAVRVPARSELRKDVAMTSGPEVDVELTVQPWKRPARGVTVRLTRDGEFVADAVTDDSGRARVRASGYGDFTLHIESADLASPPDETVRFVFGEDLEPKRFDVWEGGTIVAHTLGPTGEPLAGVTVWLRARGADQRSLTSDRDGAARFEHVHPGMWSLDAQRPGGRRLSYASVRLPDRTIETVVLQPRPMGTVRGRVLGHDRVGVAGVVVQLSAAPDATGEAPPRAPIRIETGVDGSFELTDVLVGTWIAQPLPGALTAAATPQPVVVRPDEDAAVELPVEWERPSLAGRVRDVDGEGLAGFRLMYTHGAEPVETDADGRFRLIGLVPGKRVRFTSADRSWSLVRVGGPAVLLWRAGSDEAVAIELMALPRDRGTGGGAAEVPISARVVGTPRVEAGPLSARTKRTTVTGRVVSGRAHPLREVAVSAGAASTITDEHGRFRLPGVRYDPERGFVELHLVPGPGLYLPATLSPYVKPDGETVVGDVQLGTRPYLVLDGESIFRRQFGWWRYVSRHGDRFLGIATEPEVPVECVTYDATWLHVPPYPAEGPGLVLVGIRDEAGLHAGLDDWKPGQGSPDRMAVTPATWRGQSASFEIPAGYRNGWLRVQQLRVGDQRQWKWWERVTDAEPDVFETLARDQTWSRRLKKHVSVHWPLTSGLYLAHLEPAKPGRPVLEARFTTTRSKRPVPVRSWKPK